MAELVKSLADIFSASVFFVPDYQRGYAWSEKQWGDLIQDIELLPEGRNHFTGTLILRPSAERKDKVLDEEGRAYKAFDIIDGQQRLTTAVILLQSIYDAMVEIPSFIKLANGLREMYLANFDLNKQPFAKITLNRDSRDFFLKNVLGLDPDIKGPTIRSHKLLLQAKKYFENYLAHQRETLKADFPDWLKVTYLKITQNIKLIVYEVEQEVDAGVIFETMNDRGRPLTDLEKVKNYLLYLCSKLDLHISHDLDVQINQTWTHIFEELMSTGISESGIEDQLLRDHWLTVYDYNLDNWDQSRTIKTKFNLRGYVGRHDELLADVKYYLSTLRDATTAFCDFYNPSRAGAFSGITDPKIRQQIVFYSQKMARLGIRASYHPILIAARTKCIGAGAGYLDILKLCEKYEIRVCRWMRRPRAGQSALFKLGNEFFKHGNLQQVTDGIKQSSWLYCTDVQFSQRFGLEGEDWYAWDGLKYFLYEYEQYLADKKGVMVKMPWEDLIASRKEDTIEHILPQTPVDIYWKDRFPLQEELGLWINDIGNLTLTYNNSPMKNKPFRKGLCPHDDKVSYYADSTILIEQTLKDFVDWNPESIKQRREQIKVWAVSRWKLDPPSGGWEGIRIKGVDVTGLSRTERRELYLKNFQERADQLGNGDEFRAIIELAQKFPLYLYLNPNYDAPSFNLPTQRKTFMIWISPSLYVSVNMAEFDRTYHLKEGTTSQIMGNNQRVIKHEEIPDFLERLSKLLITINSSYAY